MRAPWEALWSLVMATLLWGVYFYVDPPSPWLALVASVLTGSAVAMLECRDGDER